MRTSSFKKLFILGRAAILGVVLSVLIVPTGLAAPPGSATTTKIPKPRTVEGVVHDKSGSPIKGAVVYLKDARSLAVKSYLSNAQGQFHFRELSMDLDYDLWAELHGERSKTYHVSRFDNKPDLHFTLKIDIGK